jgi:excisionase family DNA binding protein
MGSPKDKAPRRRLLTYDEAGEYLAVGRTTMYDLVGKGALQTVKIGRCTRFRPEDLEDFIESQLTRRGQ